MFPVPVDTVIPDPAVSPIKLCSNTRLLLTSPGLLRSGAMPRSVLPAMIELRIVGPFTGSLRRKRPPPTPRVELAVIVLLTIKISSESTAFIPPPSPPKKFVMLLPLIVLLISVNGPWTPRPPPLDDSPATWFSLIELSVINTDAPERVKIAPPAEAEPRVLFPVTVLLVIDN